jgi:hypothetical protein
MLGRERVSTIRKRYSQDRRCGMYSRRCLIVVLAAAVLLLVAAGCHKGAADKIDTFVITQVYDKIDHPSGCKLLVTCCQDRGERYVIKLKESEGRPLDYIWSSIEQGSNVAIPYFGLQDGKPLHKADGIFGLTTDEIVLCDKPGDLEKMIQIATEKRKEMKADAEQMRKELRECWAQATRPKE